jgi:hypothetical protein
VDTPVQIIGSNFVEGCVVKLGSAELTVLSVTDSLIEALVPKGLEPSVYTLIVQNPGQDGKVGALPNAFTVLAGAGGTGDGVAVVADEGKGAAGGGCALGPAGTGALWLLLVLILGLAAAGRGALAKCGGPRSRRA